MSAMESLIPHTGDHGAGASSLQSTLPADPLAKHLIYPRKIHNGAVGAGTAIISEREFELGSPQTTLQRICAATEGRVDRIDAIICVCAHAPRILSSFIERVRSGVGPFDQERYLEWALRGDRFAYAPRLRKWKQALTEQGGELKIRVIDKSNLAEDDPVKGYSCAAGRVSPDWATEAREMDTASSAKALRMAQIYGEAHDRVGGPSQSRACAASVLRTATAAFPDGPAPRWTMLQMMMIRAALRSDAEDVDHIIGDAGGFLAAALDDAVEAASVAETSSPTFTPETELAVRAAAQASALKVRGRAGFGHLAMASGREAA